MALCLCILLCIWLGKECNMLIFVQGMFYFICNVFSQHPEGPAKCLLAHALVRGEGRNAPRYGSFSQISALPHEHSNTNHCMVSVSGYWGHSSSWPSAGPLATTSVVWSTPWSFNVVENGDPYKWLDVKAESLFYMKEFCLLKLWQFSNQYYFINKQY